MSKIESRSNIERHYRARECAAIAGIGLSTWWSWVKQGRVSRGISLSPAIRVWPESELAKLFDAKAGADNE